jgi:hypothetical protein
MLLTFLVAMLALIIAVLVGAALNPEYRGDTTGQEGAGTPDWKASV